MIIHFTTNVRPHQHTASRWGSCFTLACALHVLPVHAAILEGKATYRERIMPPPDAVLVVVLQDTARADAAAIELGSVRIRLNDSPPYRWRHEYDERATGKLVRLESRGRIETPAGLWMTADRVAGVHSSTRITTA